MRATRPVAYGERAMVATPHYLASIAALDALRDGGNAVDAALTAVAVLGAALPHMTGIGGDAFWLIYDAESRALAGIDGSGAAGRGVNLEAYARESAIPWRGPRAAITVPGALDSWRLAHARFGRLPLPRLLAPAIGYARDGVPVSGDVARWIGESREALAADPGASDVFLAGGSPPAQGARFCQSALGKTLESIAERGPRWFYSDAARSVTAYLGQRGGLLDAEDFSAYQARWVDPISVRYRDYKAFQLPPPSQGMAGLLILNALARYDLTPLGDGSARYFDAMIRAIRWALGQRDAHLADPTSLDVAIDTLLDPAAAVRALATSEGGEDAKNAGIGVGNDTVFVATADAAGNAVALVQSLYFDFGAAVLDPETGVLLQNRGAAFSLDPRHPNALGPGKRPASTLMAGMLFRDGLPYLIHGTQGGDVQAQTNASIVTRLVDFGRDVQAAIEAPRLLCGRSWGDAADQLLVEERAAESAVRDLVRMGYPAEPVAWPHPRMGTAQAIRLKGAGRDYHEGGADPRGEGLALGY